MKKCNASDLKPGDTLYEVSYHTVRSVDNEFVHVTTEGGGDVKISRSVVEDSIFSTDQYEHEKKVTLTELAQKIETLGHSAFRVTFRLQVTPNDVADGLEGADCGTKAKRRKLVKDLMEGKTRVMHARLHRTDEFDASQELGRYLLVDLDELKKMVFKD